MVLLGVDPGLAATGWGLVQSTGPRPASLGYGCLRTSAGEELGYAPGHGAALAVAHDGVVVGDLAGEGGTGGAEGVEAVHGAGVAGEVLVRDVGLVPGGLDAEAGVVGGDDGVALVGEGEGDDVAVEEGAVGRGGAVGEPARGAVGPEDDGGLFPVVVVAEGLGRVGPEDVGRGGDQGAVDVGGGVDDPREARLGGQGVGPRVGDVLHLDDLPGPRGHVEGRLVEGVEGVLAGPAVGELGALEVEDGLEDGFQGRGDAGGGELLGGELEGGVPAGGLALGGDGLGEGRAGEGQGGEDVCAHCL